MEIRFASTFGLSSRNVLVTQPGANVWAFEYPWSTDLCSCCQNTKQCSMICAVPLLLMNQLIRLGCYAFFCPCCFQCELFKRSGENMWACICPGALYALRTKIRTAFRIEVRHFFFFFFFEWRTFP